MKSRIPLLAAIVSLTISGLTHAATILVPNGDFEISGTAGYANTSGLVSNFVESGGEYYGRGYNSGFSPNAFSGSQNVFFNVNNGDSSYPTSTATLTTAAPVTTFAANTVYTLTVALGDSSQANNTDYGSPGDQSFSFQANGVNVDTFTLPNLTLANGSSKDYSLMLDTSSMAFSALVGDSLNIQLADTQPVGSAPVQGHFDNIRLTTEAVPEPSTYIMLFGGFSMLVFVSRFHKITG